MICIHLLDVASVEIVVEGTEVLVWMDDECVIFDNVGVIESELYLLWFGCQWHRVSCVYHIQLPNPEQV